MVAALILSVFLNSHASALAPARVPDSEMRLLRSPSVRGDKIVFSYAGDLWSIDKNGEPARHLTSHPNLETRARISPDGTMIAFTGNYDGNPEVYVIPIDGGEPKRLTFNPQADSVVGWTPDGKVAFISSSESNTDNHNRLWLVSPKGGLPQPTPVLEAWDVSFSPDGSKVAYHRLPGDAQNWRQYRGGRQARISIYDLKNNQYSELPSAGEQSFSPLWVGDSIYYLSDKENDAVNLYRYDLNSKQATRLTDFKDAVMKSPDTDGKTIVFERDGNLYAYDIAAARLRKLSPKVPSEDVAARPALKKLGGQITSVGLSPDGSKVCAEARGEIFTVDVKHGDAVDLTNSSGARDRFPAWSPDGKWIAYASDASGECEVWMVSAEGGKPVQLTNGQGPNVISLAWSPDSKKIAVANRAYQLKYVDVGTHQITTVVASAQNSIGSFDWSPDSKWIAYVDTLPNLFSGVFLFDTTSSKRTQVSEGDFSDDFVVFDPGGRYLYVGSARVIVPNANGDELNVSQDAFKHKVYALRLTRDQGSPGSDRPADYAAKKPSEFRIDLEGLSKRMDVLPFEAGDIQGIGAAKDGVAAVTKDGVDLYTLGQDVTEHIFSGNAASLAETPDGAKMVYFAGGTLGVVDMKPGQHVGSGRVDTSSMEAVISPREEWKQIFWEAWRFERDNYYDPNMRGLNWKAIGDHYAGMLPYVAHRSDLTYVLSLMVAELRTSHSYVLDGDPWFSQPAVPVGMLGADYETANGKIRFKRIYYGASYDASRRGPLSEPGADVKAGDYLLEIDGHPLDDITNPHVYLVDKANKWVTLTVNGSPSIDGARHIRAKAIANESALRYFEWVESNRRYVDQASGGKIGYMHVPNTSEDGAVGVVDGYYRNSDKQALIVDERNNHGGYNPTFFVNRIGREVVDYGVPRYGHGNGSPAQTVVGPKAMLINGWAGSGGDLFPYLFRKAKIGPLIGTRTWGGAVGIDGFYPLVDGGDVSAPEFAWYDGDTGKWIAENQGVTPDFDVDYRPDLVAQGKDPQLDKAIEYLLGEIQKQGPKKVLRPEIKKIGE